MKAEINLIVLYAYRAHTTRCPHEPRGWDDVGRGTEQFRPPSSLIPAPRDDGPLYLAVVDQRVQDHLNVLYRQLDLQS